MTNTSIQYKPGTKAFAADHAQGVARRAWSDYMNTPAGPARDAAKSIYDNAQRAEARAYEAWVAAGGGFN